MIEKMENLAVRLIPHRKWMLAAFLVSFVVAMPAAFGLMILFKNPIFFFAGEFLSVFGFVWSWGLFLISFWYNPNGGPLTLEKIKQTHWFFRSGSYLMRYYAPVFLIIWFLSPFVIVVMMYPFARMIGQ